MTKRQIIKATADNLGTVRPDNTTITVNDGVLTAESAYDIRINDTSTAKNTGQIGPAKLIPIENFNIDTLIEPGTYSSYYTPESNPTGTWPVKSPGAFILTVDYSDQLCIQKFTFHNGNVYTRHAVVLDPITWDAWFQFLNGNNIGSGLVLNNGVISSKFVSAGSGLVLSDDGNLTSKFVSAGTGLTLDSAGNLTANAATNSSMGIVQPDNSTVKVSNGILSINQENPIGGKPGDYVLSPLSERNGALLCDGSSVSKTTYKRLFDVIGVKFGDAGDKFRLPDFRGRVPQAAGNFGIILNQSVNNGAPNITGKLNNSFRTHLWDNMAIDYGSGALRAGLYSTDGGDRAGVCRNLSISFDASKSNGIYGASSYIQPYALGVNVFIIY